MEWRGKTYRSCFDINAEDLLELLALWEKKKIKPEEVANFGEDVLVDLCDGKWPESTKGSQEDFLISILELLEMLYTNPILPKDIPILKETLLISQEDPGKASRMLDEYFDNIEWEERLYYTTVSSYPE